MKVIFVYDFRALQTDCKREVRCIAARFTCPGTETFFAGLVNPIWALFDDERQALHDKISGTVVAYAPDGLPGSSKADGRPPDW